MPAIHLSNDAREAGVEGEDETDERAEIRVRGDVSLRKSTVLAAVRPDGEHAS